jgi:hypothetical protein
VSPGALHYIGHAPSPFPRVRTVRPGVNQRRTLPGAECQFRCPSPSYVAIDRYALPHQALLTFAVVSCLALLPYDSVNSSGCGYFCNLFPCPVTVQSLDSFSRLEHPKESWDRLHGIRYLTLRMVCAFRRGRGHRASVLTFRLSSRLPAQRTSVAGALDLAATQLHWTVSFAALGWCTLISASPSDRPPALSVPLRTSARPTLARSNGRYPKCNGLQR